MTDQQKETAIKVLRVLLHSGTTVAEDLELLKAITQELTIEYTRDQKHRGHKRVD